MRMHPEIRRDLPRLGQLDHVHRRHVAALAAGPAFQRRFEFPDRRIAGTADGVERKARAGLAAVALDLEPAEPAIEALPDGRRWLRRPAKTLHADRPGFGFGAVGRANGLFGGLPRALGADLRAPDPAAIDGFAGLCTHGRGITAALAGARNAARISARSCGRATTASRSGAFRHESGCTGLNPGSVVRSRDELRRPKWS